MSSSISSSSSNSVPMSPATPEALVASSIKHIKEKDIPENILSILFKSIIEAPANLEEQKSVQCFLQCAALNVNKIGTYNDEYSNDTTFGRIVSSGLSDHWLQLTEGEIPKELAPIAEIARQIVAPNAEQKFYKLYQALLLQGYRHSGILPTTLEDFTEMQRKYQEDCNDALCKIACDQRTPLSGFIGCNPETCGFTGHDTPAEKANKVRRWLQNNETILSQQGFLCFTDTELKVLPPEIFLYFGHVRMLGFFNNQLQAIKLENLPTLEILYIEGSPLESINLQNLPSLNKLNIHHTPLQAIDLQHLGALREAYLENNQLQWVCLQKVDYLHFLNLANNPLESVDLQSQERMIELILPIKPKVELLARYATHLEIPDIVKALFYSGHDEIRNTACNEFDNRIWELAGSPMDGNPYWGAIHRYDDAERFYRAFPIDDEVKNTFHAYGADVKNRVYGKVWELAGRPEGDDKWGEHHVFDDSYFFYSALGHVLYSGYST
ncbi:MAG: leucine-rich repeat domain-containing protein [Verrucomicrobia bacterium]|nr:leucine-rich repeat domain-containing protein [Verrucomicrobiota bacterium]